MEDTSNKKWKNVVKSVCLAKLRSIYALLKELFDVSCLAIWVFHHGCGDLYLSKQRCTLSLWMRMMHSWKRFTFKSNQSLDQVAFPPQLNMVLHQSHVIRISRCDVVQPPDKVVTVPPCDDARKSLLPDSNEELVLTTSLKSFPFF